MNFYTFKPVARLAAIGLAALVARESLAFTEVARGSLTAGATASAAYDSNIFGNHNENADEVFALTPDLSYARNAGALSLFASAGVKFTRFSDYTSQNSEDPFAKVKLNYDGGEKLTAKGGFSYERRSETNEALLNRTRSDEYLADVSADYYYSEKLGLRPRANLGFSRSKTAGYNDVDRWSVGLGHFYRYSPKLALLAGYDYRSIETRHLLTGLAKPDSNDHQFSVGVEGELAPKLFGSVNLGAVYRDFKVSGSSWQPYAQADVSWHVQEKASVFATVSSDFDTTASGQSSKNVRNAVGVRYSLSTRLLLTTSVGYEHIKYAANGGYSDRTDRVVPVNFGMDYSINEYLQLGGGFSWRHSKSDLVFADYDRTVFTLKLAARY